MGTYVGGLYEYEGTGRLWHCHNLLVSKLHEHARLSWHKIPAELPVSITSTHVHVMKHLL